MSTQTDRPMRWRFVERVSGRRGRNAILAAGGVVLVLFVWLMMFRGFEGRPLLLNDNGSVKQAQILCGPAYKSVTASFNKADPTVPDQIRVCVERGRARVFVTGLYGGFIALLAWGLSRMPGRGARRRLPPSDWDEALKKTRRRQQQSPGSRAGTG